ARGTACSAAGSPSRAATSTPRALLGRRRTCRRSPGTAQGTRRGSTTHVGGPVCRSAAPVLRTRDAHGVEQSWVGPSVAVPFAVLFEDRVRPLSGLRQGRSRLLGEQDCFVQCRCELRHGVPDARK